MEEQGRKVDAFTKTLHTADEDRVVSGQMGGFVLDFKSCTATRQDRGAAQPLMPGQTGKAVGRPGGKTVREVLLLDREDVDRVMAGFTESFQIVRAVVQTPENKRRVKRHSREGVDRQPDRMAVGIDRRNNGDAGGKTAKGIAQGAGIGLYLGHRSLICVKRVVLSVLPQLESRQILRNPHPFTAQLVAWQKTSGRHDLPWQNTRDPYRIWLSEIMLQQTQVSTVIPYYTRFLESFPDVAALAAAPIERVIEHWAGLGYYARARNLHRCAIEVACRHDGQFPKTPAALAELPGIGRSTAAAIAAFAFGVQAAILDGNVKRVLCRQFGIEGFPGSKAVENQLWALAESLLPESGIEAYTQGLMDLGATCCTRSRPRCEACPVADTCFARRAGRQAELPMARPRAAIPERESVFALITDGQRILLERRPPSGLWGGLLVPPEGSPSAAINRLGLLLLEESALPPLRHTFTHFHLTLKPILCRVVPAQGVAEVGLEWVDLAQAADAGVPTPIRKLLKQVASEQG